MKRIIYLAYYIKNLDTAAFLKYLNYTKGLYRKSAVTISSDILISVFKYNSSILEYFQFHFIEKNHTERLKWAGTGYMFEYQLKMNPKKQRDILDDKTKFYTHYKKYFIHQVADVSALKSDASLEQNLISNPSGKVVFKVADGKCGKQVVILPTEAFKKESLVAYMEKNKFDLVEEFILQHPKLNELAPTAVNTVRIFTQLNNNNEVEILGCRLRISVNSLVDNMAAGNLAACIDEVTGIVNSPAVYSDITKQEVTKHPITGVEIVGFQIPFWKQTLAMAKEAALLHPQNRSIGWDIVITEKGPGFIEGNHDWCKLLWQLPAKKGLKHLLEVHQNAL
jgi:hypothetical protein